MKNEPTNDDQVTARAYELHTAAMDKYRAKPTAEPPAWSDALAAAAQEFTATPNKSTPVPEPRLD